MFVRLKGLSLRIQVQYDILAIVYQLAYMPRTKKGPIGPFVVVARRTVIYAATFFFTHADRISTVRELATASVK